MLKDLEYLSYEERLNKTMQAGRKKTGVIWWAL